MTIRSFWVLELDRLDKILLMKWNMMIKNGELNILWDQVLRADTIYLNWMSQADTILLNRVSHSGTIILKKNILKQLNILNSQIPISSKTWSGGRSSLLCSWFYWLITYLLHCCWHLFKLLGPCHLLSAIIDFLLLLYEY